MIQIGTRTTSISRTRGTGSAGSTWGQQQQHFRINWDIFHQIFLWTNISGTWQNCSFSINLKSKQIIYLFDIEFSSITLTTFLLNRRAPVTFNIDRPPQVLCAGITTTLLFSGEVEAESVGLMFQMTFDAYRAYFSLYLQIWIKSHLHYVQGICLKHYYPQIAILTFSKVCYSVKVKVLQGYIARIT